jgi:hypothetical protein
VSITFGSQCRGPGKPMTLTIPWHLDSRVERDWGSGSLGEGDFEQGSGPEDDIQVIRNLHKVVSIPHSAFSSPCDVHSPH